MQFHLSINRERVQALFSLFIVGVATISCSTTTIGFGQDPYMGRRNTGYFQNQQEERPATRIASNGDVGCACPDTKNRLAANDETLQSNRPQARGMNNEHSANDKPSYFQQATPPPDKQLASAVSDDLKNETSPQDDFINGVQTGTASWYGKDFDGKKTASGEIFDSRKLTAAHRKLPLGTVVLVKNKENGREILLTVNDRGPYVGGRVLDSSEYGAELLGYKEKGLTTVEIRVVRKGDVKARGEGATAAYFKHDKNEDGENVKEPPVQTATLIPATVVSQVKPERSLNLFSVQVGIFDDSTNAFKMRDYIAAYGESVSVFRRGEKFVVKAGRFSNRVDAEEFKRKLENNGYTGFVSEPE